MKHMHGIDFRIGRLRASFETIFLNFELPKKKSNKNGRVINFLGKLDTLFIDYKSFQQESVDNSIHDLCNEESRSLSHAACFGDSVY